MSAPKKYAPGYRRNQLELIRYTHRDAEKNRSYGLFACDCGQRVVLWVGGVAAGRIRNCRDRSKHATERMRPQHSARSYRRGLCKCQTCHAAYVRVEEKHRTAEREKGRLRIGDQRLRDAVKLYGLNRPSFPVLVADH